MLGVEWFDFIVMGLATFRLARLLVIDDFFRGLRELTGIEYVGDEIISYPEFNPLYCIWCTGFWVAPIIMITYTFGHIAHVILFWLALSAVAGLLHGKS